MVGDSYRLELGVEEDKKKAFGIYFLLAASGNAAAQFMTGVCYRYGDGIEKNEKTGFEWCMKSAKQGYADAQFIVSMAYESGTGVEKDLKKSLYWLNKSAKGGNAEAQRELAKKYFAIMEDMDNQRKQYQNIALYWVNELAEGGDETAKQIMEASTPEWFEKTKHSENEKEFFDVQVEVSADIGVRLYYMTDNYTMLEKYLESTFNFSAPLFYQFSDNEALSENVRGEMQKRECVFSVTADDNILYINFYDGDIPKIVMANLK